MRPFRWDIKRREQLGRLAEGELSDAYPEFVDDLRGLSAHVIAASRDADIAFIGRSPESVFDYLSGVLLDTAWSERLLLVNLSMRYNSPRDVRRDHPEAMAALQHHLAELQLSPAQLIKRQRPVALVDLVSSGSTFRYVTELIMEFAKESTVDLAAVRQKLRFVGITWRTKNSPNTYRWHQHAGWLDPFSGTPVRNISIPGPMWNYLGNSQAKVTSSNPPWRWGDPNISVPPRDEANLAALRRALTLFDLGASVEERRRFSDALCKETAMRFSWFRQLVTELRGHSRS